MVAVSSLKVRPWVASPAVEPESATVAPVVMPPVVTPWVVAGLDVVVSSSAAGGQPSSISRVTSDTDVRVIPS